jgi:hypothetical protein
MNSLTDEDKVTLSYAKGQKSNALMRDMVELVERLEAKKIEWPIAKLDQVAGGWELEYSFLAKVADHANRDSDFQISMEDAEQVLIAARQITNSEE